MDTSAEKPDDSSKPSPKKRRKPSTGFPVVPLPEAAKIIREAGKYGFEHSISAFARYMGHSTTNSGAFRQRLAAFRDWKLIAGRGDTVVFTDTAKSIAVPPDRAAEHEALQTAFMNCAVFSSLYESVTKGQPVEAQHLGAKAVHELGISPSASDRFTSSFIESAVAAGLAESENGEIVLLELGAAAGGDGVDEDDVTEEEGAATAPARGRPPSVGSPVVRQEWPLPSGAVLFEVRLDRPLPAALFTQLGSVVEQVEALASRLQQVLDPDDAKG